MSILVTGFSAFENRTVNASWIAASSLKDVVQLEIPVIWGQPATLLNAAFEQYKPRMIISMGEGREGWFDIETVARNERKQRQDTAGMLPIGPIVEGGEDKLQATIPAKQLHALLAAERVPIRISEDAGAFLCEEALYALETLKTHQPTLETVVFVHLPPFGSSLVYRDETRTCDRTLLSDFADLLLTHTMKINKTSIKVGE